MQFVSGMIWNPVGEVAAVAGPSGSLWGKGKGKEKEKEKEKDEYYVHFGKKLPKAWDIVQEKLDPDVLRGCKRVVVIGIHGWFPGKF